MDAAEAKDLWPRADVDVNPLQAAESHHFNARSNGDYRATAIEDVARNGLPFQSTCNCIFTLTEQAIPTLVCPYCRVHPEGFGVQMPLMQCTGHGGGNGVTFSIGYRCEKCGATASITLTAEGLSFRPKET